MGWLDVAHSTSNLRLRLCSVKVETSFPVVASGRRVQGVGWLSSPTSRVILRWMGARVRVESGGVSGIGMMKSYSISRGDDRRNLSSSSMANGNTSTGRISRVALRGDAILANPHWNKGTAFTVDERKLNLVSSVVSHTRLTRLMSSVSVRMINCYLEILLCGKTPFCKVSRIKTRYSSISFSAATSESFCP